MNKLIESLSETKNISEVRIRKLQDEKWDLSTVYFDENNKVLDEDYFVALSQNDTKYIYDLICKSGRVEQMDTKALSLASYFYNVLYSE